MPKNKLVMAKDMAGEYALIKAVEEYLNQMSYTGPIEIELVRLDRLTFRNGDNKVGVSVAEDGAYHVFAELPDQGLLGAVFPSIKTEAVAEFICEFVIVGGYPK